MPPSPEAAACIERLVTLRDSSTHARLRALMPTIDALTRQGVRQQDIVSTLNAAGIPITLPTFRKRLYRWRGQNKHAASHDRHPLPSLAPSAPALSADPASSEAVKSVTNKAQLRQLRQSTVVDLEQLAKAGRKPQE